MPVLALLASATIAITPATLAGLAAGSATLDLHGERHACQGPRLIDVLTREGAPSGEALRGTALRKGVLVVAADGYAVLFSLAELDPTLGARIAILADRCDGRSLTAADGPVRLVVEGDKRPARSVRQVARIVWIDD